MRQVLKETVEPFVGGSGFTGRAPGGPSRWSTKGSTEWQSLKPDLVAEVRYDHFSGAAFVTAQIFFAGVPRKASRCAFDQLEVNLSADAEASRGK